MGIAKFDDGIPDNPKFGKAGPVASWLWFCAICYSRRVLSDGVVPKDRIPMLVSGLNATASFRAAAALVEAGLFEEAVGGYVVHDYHEWNPTKAVVNEYRRRDKLRKQNKHSGVETSRPPSGFLTDSERRRASHAGAKSESESKSESEDLEFRDESAREGDDLPPVWTHTGSERGVGLVGNHRGCYHGAGATAACARGFCVPAWLGAIWTRQYGDDAVRAAAEIAAFITAELGKLRPGPVGDTPKDFWLGAWKAQHGSQAPRLAGKGRQTVDAFRVAGERLAAEGGKP